MKEIGFSEFRLRYSAVIQQVQKTREPIRVMRLGKPLAEIVPLPLATSKPDAKRQRNQPPREARAYLGR